MKVQTPFLPAVAIAATLTLAAIAPNVANAASITHTTASFSFDQDTYQDDYFLVGSGLLPYFKAALGKLNSVTYQVLGDSTASISVTNNSIKLAKASGQTVTYGYGVLKPQNYGYFGGYNQGAYASVSGTLDKKGPPGATLTNTQTNNYTLSSPSTLTDPYYLGLFTGADEFAVDFNGYLSSSVSTTLPQYAVASAATSGLSAQITYDYTPIPTPALLPGLLAMGIGIVRRRKAEAAAEAEA